LFFLPDRGTQSERRTAKRAKCIRNSSFVIRSGIALTHLLIVTLANCFFSPTGERKANEEPQSAPSAFVIRSGIALTHLLIVTLANCFFSPTGERKAHEEPQSAPSAFVIRNGIALAH